MITGVGPQLWSLHWLPLRQLIDKMSLWVTGQPENWNLRNLPECSGIYNGETRQFSDLQISIYTADSADGVIFHLTPFCILASHYYYYYYYYIFRFSGRPFAADRHDITLYKYIRVE